MAKKRQFKDYDGSSNRCVILNAQVLTSEALLSCSALARNLYIYMRYQQYGVNERDHPEGDNEKFVFTFTHCKKYRITSNKQSFTKARDELIEKGLIKCVADNSHCRKANIYQYSNEWKHYTEQKEVKSCNMTKSMRNKSHIAKGLNAVNNANIDFANDDEFRKMFCNL